MSDFARSLKTAWFGVKNHKNALLVLSIFCVILFPAFTMIAVSGQHGIDYYSAEYQIVLSVYGGIVAVAAGLVFPIIFFSYLYNRIECDFYNAMPVRRSQYFWGYFAASIVIFIIPWSITAIIHCFITEWGNNLWKPFLLSLGLFFVLYCSMIFAVTFSGSKLCAVLTFAIMNVLPVMVVLFPITAAGADTISYGQRLVDNIMALTPASAVYWFFDENQFSYVIPIQLGFALAELIAAFFMFKYRKSESTMALAFPKTRYYYQYGILLLTAVYICYLFTNGRGSLHINFEDGRLKVQNYNDFTRDFWVQTIFFTLVFVLIAFILTNMILEKSPRAAFKKIRHYFFFLGGYVIFLLITIPLAINFLPKSVLPFTPNYAAVYVYGYEEITEEEYNKMNDNYLYFYTAEINAAKSHEKKDFINEYGDWVSDYERENHYYKKIVKDAFIVTDKEKLDKLTDSLSDYSKNEYPDFIIFPTDESWYSLSKVGLVFVEELPDSNYTEFKIAFGRDLNITSDMDESELDYRVTYDDYYPNTNIFVKENIAVRKGYAVDPSLVTEYKDYNINLDPNRFFRDVPNNATPADWAYLREVELQ